MTAGQIPRPDPRGSAVALSYRRGGEAGAAQAPVLVAKGYGVAAESILREARAHGLYVHSSPELVGLLMQVQLDREVPPALYRAVAEVMAWVHGLENDTGVHL